MKNICLGLLAFCLCWAVGGVLLVGSMKVLEYLTGGTL